MANSTAATKSVIGVVDSHRGRGKKKNYAIIFSEVPEGIMRSLRREIGDMARINRNSSGGINIRAANPCCRDAITELALHIGELGLGLSVDARTIPGLPA